MQSSLSENTSDVLAGVQFLFIDRSGDLVAAWDRAFSRHVPEHFQSRLETLGCDLEKLPPEHATFDCIVSPANSFGRLDGGFDFYISKVLAPLDDFEAPTRIAQSVLYDRWRGCIPPGSCTLVPLNGTVCSSNRYNCKFIALCPTMRRPENVSWDADVVYNCFWSLLVAIDRYNKDEGQSDSGAPRIAKVIVPGLATGIGGISAEKCAIQMAFAIKHFCDAIKNPKKWSNMQWHEIKDIVAEVIWSRPL